MQEEAATIQTQQLLKAQIDHYQGARAYSAAIRACFQLVKTPGRRREVRARLAGLYLARAAAGLHSSTDPRPLRRDLCHLQRAIAVTETLRRQDPDIAAIYEVVGRLYRLLAIRQADAGQLDQARASSRRARIYFPDPGDALFERDDEAELALAAQRLRAVQRSLWHAIGLAVPEQNWDNQAALLSRVVTATIATLPTGRARLVETWDYYVEAYPDLKQLDRERILRFLHETLFSSTHIQQRWIGGIARALGEQRLESN